MSARERIVRYLIAFSDSDLKTTSAYMAIETGIEHAEVISALDQLVQEGLVRSEVAGVMFGAPLVLYRIAVETIGTCDICGQTDHHLIDDVCSSCRPKVVNLGARSPGFYACGEDDEL